MTPLGPEGAEADKLLLGCAIGLIVLILLLTSGCAYRARVIDPLQFEPATVHAPPTLEQLVVNAPHALIPPKYEMLEPGACTNTGGILLENAADLPPFVGYLIAEADWLRLVAAYPRRVEEIKDLVLQQVEDRRHARTVDAQKIEVILACRESKREAFVFGIGMGAGACAVTYGALDRIVGPE